MFHPLAGCLVGNEKCILATSNDVPQQLSWTGKICKVPLHIRDTLRKYLEITRINILSGRTSMVCCVFSGGRKRTKLLSTQARQTLVKLLSLCVRTMSTARGGGAGGSSKNDRQSTWNACSPQQQQSCNLVRHPSFTHPRSRPSDRPAMYTVVRKNVTANFRQ